MLHLPHKFNEYSIKTLKKLFEKGFNVCRNRESNNVKGKPARIASRLAKGLKNFTFAVGSNCVIGNAFVFYCFSFILTVRKSTAIV